MELNKINSLVELFFNKYKENESLKNQLFLKWLKSEKKDFLTWKQVRDDIVYLSEYLKENLSLGDRCVLLSENRPEWLITDIAIMNAGGVTVPLFTTYSEKDYEYIIKGDEGHGFRSEVANLALYEDYEKFLAKYLIKN